MLWGTRVEFVVCGVRAWRGEGQVLYVEINKSSEFLLLLRQQPTKIKGRITRYFGCSCAFVGITTSLYAN